MAENFKTVKKNAEMEKKLAKKRKKEEEFLANLRKPKDTKVLLADRSLLEKLMPKNVTPSSGQPTFSAEDFPALPTDAQSKTKTKEAMSYNKIVGSYWSVPKSFPPVKTERKESVQSATQIAPLPPFRDEKKEDAKQQQTDELNKSVVSKKDPILVKLDDLIVKSTTKKEKKNGYCKGHRRGTNGEVLHNNMLDSSISKTSKGKQREIKKLKLSKLKLAIIRDRMIKLKSLNLQDETTDKKYFKTELHKYLSELTEKKLIMAEKRRIKQEEKEELVLGEADSKEQTATKKKKQKRRPTKYRNYCDNKYSEELDKSVNTLIRKIVYLQDRAFNKNPIKSKMKRRHVVGLREVKKYLLLKKIKMLILAPDLEAQDSICSIIKDLKKIASLQNVPCVFALSRRNLGAIIRKWVPVSAFGIMNYDGLEVEFKDVEEKLAEIVPKPAFR